MVSKVRNFWLCVFSGVVATTLKTGVGSINLSQLVCVAGNMSFLNAHGSTSDNVANLLQPYNVLIHEIKKKGLQRNLLD